jgi:outer membrane lipoprotein-sorting protein
LRSIAATASENRSDALSAEADKTDNQTPVGSSNRLSTTEVPMIRFAAVTLLAATSVSSLAAAHAPAPPPDLHVTLTKLNAASEKFQSAQANVHRENYVALIHDVDETTDGIVYVIRAQDGKSQFGLKTSGQHARTVDYKNGTLRAFNPATNCYNTVAAKGVDTYLTLGFGASGTDLDKAWNITDQGPETIDNIQTEKLDLVPKDPNVQANIKHVTIWVDPARDVSLKQIFFFPNGDRSTATYTNIRLNQKIDTKPFEFKAKECGK